METSNKNSLWLASQYSISLVLSLIGLKLNLLAFGSDVFSVWILIFSIWGIGSAVDFGFGISTVKFVAQYKSDINKVNNIISTGFFLFLILGLLIVASGYFIAGQFYLNNPKLIPLREVHSAKILCFISGVIFYIQYVTIIYRSVFEGHEDFIRTSKIALLNSFLNFVFIVIVYVFHLHIVYLAIFNLVTAIVQFFFYYFAFSKHYSYLKIGYNFVNIATFKEIFKFSISVQAAFFIGALIDPIAKYIIGNYSENKLIPPYEIAKRFSLAISGLYSFAFKNALPKVSKLSTKEEYIHFLSVDGVKLSKLGISFSGLFFGVFSIFFTCIFKYFYGYDESVLLFLILGLAESYNNTGYILYVFILGMGKALFLSMLQALNVVLIAVLLISCLFLFHNGLGLLGYYISVFIANITMLLFIKKHVGLSIFSFYKRTSFWKLICLNLLILIDIFISTYKTDLLMISQISFSIICLWLFKNDIKIPIKIINGIIIDKLRAG